jgi:hypothetical protein
MSSPSQPELLSPEKVWSASLLSKIKGLIPWRTFDNLNRCGNEEIYRTCEDCGSFKTFTYQCGLKFCPMCNWKISRTRTTLLRIWMKRIEQPKHIVLTRRNVNGVLTRSLFRHTMRQFGKLRRSKLLRHMRGGCVSMEVTNEGNGWHVHLHILADVRFVPADKLASAWAKLMGQDFAIVKVLDARKKDYAAEVCKYVVKGAELVSWHPEEISQFIHALKGVRFFATFGTMFDLRSKVAAEINALKPAPSMCACGCNRYRFTTETAEICREVRRK